MLIVYVFDFASQVDSLALAGSFGFHDQNDGVFFFVLVFLPVGFQLTDVGRNQPGSRVKVKGGGKEVPEPV